MISKRLNISYYSVDSKSPTIISPKNDSHWTNDRDVTFSWKYNGRDGQYKFRIQIFKIPIAYFSDESAYWDNRDVSGAATDYTPEEIVTRAVSLEYITFGSGETWEDYVYDTGEIEKSESTYNIDLTSFLPIDGDYYWRIQTEGFLSLGWSLFANDGLVRLDSGVPLIKNVCAESIWNNSPTISVLSDMSSPYMFVESESEVYRGIDDGSDRSGLYIYYDYKDESLIIRGKGGNYNKERYYGIITFHTEANADKPDPDIFVSDVVDYISPYKIDRNTNGFGPFEQSGMADDYLEWGFVRTSEKLLENGWFDNEEALKGKAIPKKFPSFLLNLGVIYGENMNLPGLVSEHFSTDKSMASLFPFTSFKVVKTRKFNFPTGSSKLDNPVIYSDGSNLIEMRYPPPFQDVFFLFNSTGTKILCYGQYKDWSDLCNVLENPLTTEGPFDLIRGWDVDNYRDNTSPEENTGTPFSGDFFSIFEHEGTNINNDGGTNNPYNGIFGNGSIASRLLACGLSDGYAYMPITLKSYVMSFNISNKEDKDSVLKIKLNPLALMNVENGARSSQKLHSISIHMSKDTDCVFASQSGFRSNILIDDIHIGRGACSPRSLSIFDSDRYTGTGKVYFKTIMNPVPNIIWFTGIHIDATAGATYTNNGQTFTVIETVAAGTTLKTYGTGSPSATGTLIKASGTGDSPITYTSNVNLLNQRIETTTFAIDSDNEYFLNEYNNNQTVAFNSIFKLKLPEYEYIPYYYPGAVSYLYSADQQAPVPNVFTADKPTPTSDIVGWDAFKIKVATQNFSDGLPWADMIYSCDYVQFSSNSIFMGQISPYLTSLTKWDTLDGTSNIIGKINNYSNIYLRLFHTKTFVEYGQFGNTTFYDGVSFDGVQYNRTNYGLFGICDFDKPTTDLDDEDTDHFCNLYLKDFSNLPIKRSIKFLSDTGENVSSVIVNDFLQDTVETINILTDQVNLSTVSGEYFFVGDKNVITSISSSLEDRVPAWLYAMSEDQGLTESLISDDKSFQGLYGSGEISIRNWMTSLGIERSFGGHYITRYVDYGTYHDFLSEQILRIIGDAPEIGSALTYRNPLNSLTLSNGDTGEITGDTFSLGNIFGVVYPNETDEQKIRIFFDVNESISGINKYRYVIQSITTENVDSDLFGNREGCSIQTNGQVKVQKVNNYPVNYSFPLLSTDHITNLTTSRSSSKIIEYLLENDPQYNVWYDISNVVDRRNDTNLTGYGVKRLYCDIPVQPKKTVMIHFQVKDKAGNISGVSSVAFYLPLYDWDKTSSDSNVIDNSDGTYTITTASNPTSLVKTGHTVVIESGKVPAGRYLVEYVGINKIVFNAVTGYGNGTIKYYIDSTPPIIEKADISVDDGNLAVYSNTIGGKRFTRSVYRSDMSASRSISISNVLYKERIHNGTSITDTYKDYDNYGNLFIGFSDNYGLHFNNYAPYSSIVNWDFSRPIPIQMKSTSIWKRYYDPDWFFDPNDVRHYTVDTVSEMALLEDSYSGNINKFPGTGGGTSITIIGLMDESTSLDSFSSAKAKSNPISRKILEFREELIGKKLVIGSDLSLKFTILHIFKSSNIHTVRRLLSSGEDYDIDPNKRNKVWIVVEDPDAICAMVLSRRFQEYPKVEGASYLSILYDLKGITGWRERASSREKEYEDDTYIDYSNNVESLDPLGDKVWHFGYPSGADVDSEISSIVDGALDAQVPGGVRSAPPSITAINGSPAEMEWGQDYFDWLMEHETFYIDPSVPLSKSSSLSTKEGWVTQIFKIYSTESISTSGMDMWQNLGHHNFVGLEIFDRFVFGDSYTITGIISSIDSANSIVNLSSGKFHFSMGGGSSIDGFEYIIEKYDGVTTTTVDTGRITDVSDDGCSIVVSSDLDFTIDSIFDYRIVVSVEALQSKNITTNEVYDIGWWPSVDGVLVAPDRDVYGSTSAADTSKGSELVFAVISSGAFYVNESGYYTFKLEGDNESYSDFTIDYMKTPTREGDITDIIYDKDNAEYDDSIVVGGSFIEEKNKTFCLKRGWHIGRFRYHSVRNQTFRSVRLLFRSTEWDAEEWVPFMASRNTYSGIYWGKNFRSIHCKILDKYNNRHPVDDISTLRNKSSQYCRAILGFDNFSSKVSDTYADRVLWAIRNAASVSGSLTQSFDPYYHGKISQSSLSAYGRTYAGQVFEEAYAIYESNIFDGGADLRFWRKITWSPETQPTGTSVEFYIRTAPSEAELIGEEGSSGKKWNNVGTDGSEIILAKFTDPNAANNLLRLTQQFNTTNENETIINRFIQFRMVLRSQNQDVVPRVDDITIIYSKENSVNFFTTTFNLESNLLRMILAYNGDSSVTSSDVALTEIQFGLCTKEEADGTVSTNFDDYTVIPTEEVFSLSSIGVQENDKFRIGIRFISASEQVPICSEFSCMWETEGIKQQVKDIKSNL